METITTKNGTKIEYYTSELEIPITNRKEHDLYVLLEVATGSDIGKIFEKVGEARRYLEKKDFASADQELINLIQVITFISEGVNLHSRAFACLVHSINDKPVGRITGEKKVMEISRRIESTGLTIGNLKNILSDVKKKFDQERELLYASRNQSNKQAIKYIFLKDSIITKCKMILSKDEGQLKELEAHLAHLEEELSHEIKPTVIQGEDGLEILYRNNFEDTCNLIAQRIPGKNPKELTSYEYERALLVVEKQIKAEIKSIENGKSS